MNDKSKGGGDHQPSDITEAGNLHRPANVDHFDVDRAWTGVRNRVQMRARRKRTVKRLRHTAAAIVTCAAVVLAALETRSFGPKVSGITSRPEQIHTAKTERDSLSLDDGSVVLLDAGSTLRVQAAFNESRREVFLTGRAHFRVAHDTLRPFHVHAAGTVTRVLGTEFTVSADSMAAVVEVAVSDGRVAFGAEEDSTRGTLLMRGDVARKSGDAVLVEPHASAQILQWINGRREFRRTLLREVIPQLNRWYAVEIEVLDSALLAQRVSADFTGIGAEAAIPELAQLLNTRATHENRRWQVGVKR